MQVMAAQEQAKMIEEQSSMQWISAKITDVTK